VTDPRQTADHSECILMTADGKKGPVLKGVISVTPVDRKHLLESFADITTQACGRSAEANRGYLRSRVCLSHSRQDASGLVGRYEAL